MLMLKLHLFLIVFIKFNCCSFNHSVQPFPFTNSSNNSSSNDSSNSIPNGQAVPPNITAVNITEINDLHIESNDFVPRFHLTALKTPRGFIKLHQVGPSTSPKPLPPPPLPFAKGQIPQAPNPYTGYYTGNPLLASLAKVSYTNLGKFLIPQIANRQGNVELNGDNILGSGDFGVINGGTFYPSEEMPHQDEDDEIMNSAHLVHKYTPANEQFERFHDFADLSSPPNMKTDFTKYVIVSSGNQSKLLDDINRTFETINNDNVVEHPYPYPENIYEQLMKIDEDNLNNILLKIPNHNKWKTLKTSKDSMARNSTAFKMETQLNRIPGNDKDPLLALS